MKFIEVKEEEMYVLVAPDGSWQGMTLAPDFATCIAMIKLMHSKGLSKSYHDLCKVNGFQILPVIVSMKQMGDEKSGFQWAKQKLG